MVEDPFRERFHHACGGFNVELGAVRKAGGMEGAGT